jgi:hypothetical protein
VSAVIDAGVGTCEVAVEPWHEVDWRVVPFPRPHDSVDGDASVGGCVITYQRRVDEQCHQETLVYGCIGAEDLRSVLVAYRLVIKIVERLVCIVAVVLLGSCNRADGFSWYRWNESGGNGDEGGREEHCAEELSATLWWKLEKSYILYMQNTSLHF